MIYQDDTPVRVLSLIKENRHAEAQANDPSQPCGRTGMYTTGLVVQHGDRTICLYVAVVPMRVRIWRRCWRSAKRVETSPW